MDSHILAVIFVVSSIISAIYFLKREKPVLKGMVYKIGAGGADYEKSLSILIAKAQEQDTKAQFILGMMYLCTDGVAEDYTKAVTWLTKAANSGETMAQCNLAVLYAKGKVLRQDYVQAYKWLRIANSLGETSSTAVLENISKKMSGEQINEAKRLANEWKMNAGPIRQQA